MGTGAISGHTGTIYGAGATGIVEVTQFKVDLTLKELDATSMASNGYEEYISGLKGASFSGTCQGTAAPTLGAGAVTLKTAGTGGATITGSCILTSVSGNVPVDGKVTWDFTGRLTGSIGVA